MPADFSVEQCDRIGAIVGGMEKARMVEDRRIDHSISYACLTEAEVTAYTRAD